MSSPYGQNRESDRDPNPKVPTVLLVEDNPADVLLVRKALQDRSAPIHLTVAHNGNEGLALLMRGVETPDLVILDLNLPKLDGFGVLAGYNPRVAPVVVFSSTQNAAEIQKALALGASEFVHKPGDLFSFIEAIQQIVRKFIPKL